MTSDGIAVVRFLFTTIWRLFTSFQIPGTHTTPAEWALFSLLAVYVFKLISNILGISLGESGSSSRKSSNSSSAGLANSSAAHNSSDVGM